MRYSEVPARFLRALAEEMVLEPGEPRHVSTTLFDRGTRLFVRWTTDRGEPVTPTTRLTGVGDSGSIQADLDAALSKRALGTRRVDLHARLQGGGELSPIESGQDEWRFDVPQGLASGQVELTLQPIETRPVAGRLLVRAYDMEALQEVARRQAEETFALAVETHSQPEVLRLANKSLAALTGRSAGRLTAAEQTLLSTLQSQQIDTSAVESAARSLESVAEVIERRLNADATRPPTLLNVASRVRLIPTPPSPSTRIIVATEWHIDEETLLALANKYTIRLLGIKSLVCADDVGWEWGCDREEPCVSWVAAGPGFFRTGVTDEGHVTKNQEWLYSQDTNIFSVADGSTVPASLKSPFIWTWQVIERDPDGPSREQIKGMAGLAGATVGAVFSGDWGSVAKNGGQLLVDTVGLFQAAIGGGHDLYPVMLTSMNNKELIKMTSGSSPGPMDSQLFSSAGYYDKFCIRTPFVGSHWQVAYWITRSS